MTDLRALAPAVGHMPGRGAGRLAWQTQAACRPGFTELPVARQKQICRGCPVVAECMRYATSDPAFGKGWRHGTSEMVYAGFTLAELAQAMGVEECRQ